MIFWIINNFGWPALIGAGALFLVFGADVKNGHNILGQPHWDPMTALVVGGLIGGVCGVVF